MSTPSEPSTNLCKILSESKRIINAQPYHFLALSLLFLLPNYFSVIIIIPSIIKPIFDESTNKDPHHELLSYTFLHLSKPQIQNLLIFLFYTLFTTLFSFCAVSTISYSSFHVFYGKHVKLTASIKSIYHSFFPLLSTSIVRLLIFALIYVPVVLLLFLVYKELNSYFIIFLMVIVFAFELVLIYFQLNWILASVVVVVESKWGYEPLRKSAYLMKGMKGLGFSLILFYGIIMLGSFWLGFYKSGLRGWNYILNVMCSLVYLTMFSLSELVAIVVLYVHCREEHGEFSLLK